MPHYTRIEPLSKCHDRDGFDCGNEPLNLFLKQIARQHAERGISRTYVLVEESASEPKPILGFFAINNCQVKIESLPPDEARRLPREVSAVRLGRLAVAKAHRKKGFGRKLLVAAMRKFLEIFITTGGIGLFVDAEDHKAKSVYEQFGFVSLPANELELFLSVKAIQKVLA